MQARPQRSSRRLVELRSVNAEEQHARQEHCHVDRADVEAGFRGEQRECPSPVAPSMGLFDQLNQRARDIASGSGLRQQPLDDGDGR